MLMNPSTAQQLLEIWNKAKGKERDAMLWGDEVPSAPQIVAAACLGLF
jgi:hypothetical protein